jgi:hypothetical protein
VDQCAARIDGRPPYAAGAFPICRHLRYRALPGEPSPLRPVRRIVGCTAAKCLYRRPEAASVEELNQGDRIAAARAASSAVEKLFSDTDGESVSSAAARAWTAAVDPAAKFYAAP